MTLHIILQPEPEKEAEFYEIEPPFDDPEQYTIFDKYRENDFAAAIAAAYAKATGRKVKSFYQDDDDDTENDDWHDPHRADYAAALIL
ncbi:MAG TPA: hypothetical protein PLZ12_09900 [Saprospiraceae bacterium]|nr:hypothetical protein [Saprospiraceae bacterium]